MSKEELRSALDERGILWSSKDTVPVLRSLLKEATDKETSASKKIEGYSSYSKKELIEKCAERGIPITGNSTKDQMIMLLTEQQWAQLPTSDLDVLSLGKYRGRCYRWIFETDPSYVTTFVQGCVKDGTAHPELKKFWRWYLEIGSQPRPTVKTEDTGAACASEPRPSTASSSNKADTKLAAENRRQQAEIEKLKADMNLMKQMVQRATEISLLPQKPKAKARAPSAKRTHQERIQPMETNSDGVMVDAAEIPTETSDGEN